LRSSTTTACICSHDHDLHHPFIPKSKPPNPSSEDTLTLNKKLAILCLACQRPLLVDAAGNGTGEKSLGTFENPSVHVRPKFRYWIPDASVSHSGIARDVQAAGEAGAGGLECLGFYLYGGSPANGGARVAAPVSWATYGFGTNEWSRFLCFLYSYF
jgi:hypothetical protein